MAAASGVNAFRRSCNETKVSSVVTAGREIITVTTEDNTVDAFQHIVSHKILSAPVLDKATGKYIGFLDVRDLVQYVVFKYEEGKKSDQRSPKAGSSLAAPPVDLRQIFDTAARMHDNPMQGISVAYLARRNRFTAVRPDHSMTKVVEHLSQPGVHRVAVLERGTNKILDIISQSTVIQFIEANKGLFATELAKTVDELKFGSRPVIPVRTTDTAVETFKIMSKHNRSGIAVVDEAGRFVGNTSGSDLKLFIQDPDRNMGALDHPIMDFLSAIRRATVEAKTRAPTITVRPEDNISKVIGKLAATRIHRVFVAADERGYKPEAVISLTDVLKYLLNFGVSPAIVVDSA